MNIFVNVLKKGNVEEAGGENKKGQRKSETARIRFAKGNWFKWFGNYSANKRQVADGTGSTTDAMKTADRSQSCSTHEATTSRTICESSQSPLEMPDLEGIIREFENSYLSPSKQDVATDGCKQKNFVRKIVEAFEVKYKVSNDAKASLEVRESQEEDKSNRAFMQAWRKRSSIFRKPFKSDSEESRGSEKLDSSSSSKQNSRDADESDAGPSSSGNNLARVSKRRCRLFDLLVNTASNEDKDATNCSKISEHQAEVEERNSAIFRMSCNNNEIEDSRCFYRSWIFSPSVSRKVSTDESWSENFSSPVDLDRRDSKNSSSDSWCVFDCFDKPESDQRADDIPSDSVKASSVDERKTMDSNDLEVISSEETMLIADDALPTTSTMIDESPKNEHNSMLQEISRIDESPKVVGAFLKDPIDVENTSIDWIPVTRKKLPRKTSLKKLLCSLSSRRLDKRFLSERNLNGEVREFQDSGYEEKSSSSTSLTSLISFAEVLLQQENSYFEFNRRCNLRTFKSKNKSNVEKERSVENQKGKQLLLTEVPREDVKLDLGPSYPSSEMITISLNRRTEDEQAPSLVCEVIPRLPKHPGTSKIPKHPFVSLTKADNSPEFSSSYVYRNSDDMSSVIIKNDLYEVEFRRSCENLRPSDVRRNSLSMVNHYDVPRRFLSKSENEILWRSELKKKEEPIYDIPRSQIIERPKSSTYDDSLSLRRKNIYMGVETDLNICSLVQRDLNFYYAALKPNNSGIFPSSLSQSSSLNGLTYF